TAAPARPPATGAMARPRPDAGATPPRRRPAPEPAAAPATPAARIATSPPSHRGGIAANPSQYTNRRVARRPRSVSHAPGQQRGQPLHGQVAAGLRVVGQGADLQVVDVLGQGEFAQAHLEHGVGRVEEVVLARGIVVREPHLDAEEARIVRLLEGWSTNPNPRGGLNAVISQPSIAGAASTRATTSAKAPVLPSAVTIRWPLPSFMRPSSNHSCSDTCCRRSSSSSARASRRGW